MGDRNALERLKRRVRRLRPRARLHSWRALGYSGAAVHGVLDPGPECPEPYGWLSHGEPSGRRAWEAAAGRLGIALERVG
jgi:hypothetical protein